MALDWHDLLAWFTEAVEIDRERQRGHAISTANALGRLFSRR
jgi:hypothetical protein